MDCPHDEDDTDYCPGVAGSHDSTAGLSGKHQEAPARDKHPPHCPASPSFARAFVLERVQPLAAPSLAALPFRFFADLASSQCLEATGDSSYSPDQPMYLTLCTLLI
jgi:hypothetical protein